MSDQALNLVSRIPWLMANADCRDRKKPWLVGVSGGADSVALLHLMMAAGFHEVVVCHLDHGLRGRASTEDAKFVKRLAATLGLKFESERADVKLRMAAKSESLETAARHLRQLFFGRCAQKYDGQEILLAHHAEDQAETVLWNLLRGSHGFKGMHGVQKMTTEAGVELELIRPLLEIRRTELAEFLKSHGHRWREDASNAEPIAIRNRLRHEALPLLAEISQRDAVAAFVRGAADMEQQTALEIWAVAQVNALDPQRRLHLPTLRNLPVAMQRLVVRKFLADHQVESLDRALIERALSLLDIANPAVVNLPGGSQLRRQAGRLWVKKHEKNSP